MTRINVVPPTELTNEHLMAEYHELPRIFSLVRSRISKGHKAYIVRLEAPDYYVLGKGHMLFFYTRCQFLIDRFTALAGELLDRGYNIDLGLYNDILDSAITLPDEWLGNYEPDDWALVANRERIQDRLNGE